VSVSGCESVCVCVFVYILIYVFIYKYEYKYTHTHTHTYVHIYFIPLLLPPCQLSSRCKAIHVYICSMCNMYMCLWKAGKKCCGRAGSEGSSCGDLAASTMMLNHVLYVSLSPVLGCGLQGLGFRKPKP